MCMKENSMYQMGRDFYAQRIAEAGLAVQTAVGPYHKVVALERLEESRLKLVQLNRREKLLDKKTP